MGNSVPVSVARFKEALEETGKGTVLMHPNGMKVFITEELLVDREIIIESLKLLKGVERKLQGLLK